MRTYSPLKSMLQYSAVIDIQKLWNLLPEVLLSDPASLNPRKVSFKEEEKSPSRVRNSSRKRGAVKEEKRDRGREAESEEQRVTLLRKRSSQNESLDAETQEHRETRLARM